MGEYENKDDEEVLLLAGLSGFVRHERPPTWRHWLWACMEQSASEHYRIRWLSAVAVAVSCFSQLLIFVATINFIVASVPGAAREVDSATRAVETFCSLCFTAEFALRFCACPCRTSNPKLLCSQRQF
eukprot:gene49702-12452_t